MRSAPKTLLKLFSLPSKTLLTLMTTVVGVLVVGLDRELLDRRLAVVVFHRTGDAVALGRGDARVVGHDPDLLRKGCRLRKRTIFSP